MDKNVHDIIEMSRAAGADERLIQAGGGNTSVKTPDGRLMYVKASGTSLGEMAEGRGYRLLDVEKCVAMLEDDTLRAVPPVEREGEVLRRLLGCCVDSGEGRPSVESSLHALLGRCVLHTHPSVVNGLLCAHEGRKVLEALFGHRQPPCLYVEYTDPGFPLAIRLKEELFAYRKRHGRLPEVIFLENHGLFVSAEKPGDALALTRRVFGRVEAEWQNRAAQSEGARFKPLPNRDDLAARVSAAMRSTYTRLYGRPAQVRFGCGEAVSRFLARPDVQELIRGNPLTPDQVVYCGGMPLWLDSAALQEDAAEAVGNVVVAATEGSKAPSCLLARGVGLFAAAPNAGRLAAAFAMMEATLETLSAASCFGGPRGISDAAVQYIRNWEAERYRQSVSGAAE